jgi:hypothetical protein
MSVTIPIRAIELTPGSMISIHNLSWQDFEQILAELGEKRSTRIAYYRGTLALRVSEVWIYRNRQLKIYILQNADYAESSVSSIFPNLPITEMIPQLVQKAIDEGTSRMLRELKIQLDQ